MDVEQILSAIVGIPITIIIWYFIIKAFRKSILGEGYVKKKKSLRESTENIAKVVGILAIFAAILLITGFALMSMSDFGDNATVVVSIGLPILLLLFIAVWVAIARAVTADDDNNNIKVEYEDHSIMKQESVPISDSGIKTETNPASKQQAVAQKKVEKYEELQIDNLKKNYEKRISSYELEKRRLEKEKEETSRNFQKQLDELKQQNAQLASTIRELNQKATVSHNTGINGKTNQEKNKRSYKIINVKQGTQAWLKTREGRVTGTTAHFLRDYSVMYAVSKNDISRNRGYQSDSMIRGHELEPIGIARFAKKYDKKVKAVGFCDSTIYEHAGFSPDGVVLDENGNIKTIIEHKAFNPRRHFANYGEIETNILYQIQYGMFVTGARDAYLVLFNPDIDEEQYQLLVKYVRRDKSIQDLFRKKFEPYKKI